MTSTTARARAEALFDRWDGRYDCPPCYVDSLIELIAAELAADEGHVAQIQTQRDGMLDELQRIRSIVSIFEGDSTQNKVERLVAAMLASMELQIAGFRSLAAAGLLGDPITGEPIKVADLGGGMWRPDVRTSTGRVLHRRGACGLTAGCPDCEPPPATPTTTGGSR